MQPNPLRYSDYLDDGFGELKEKNRLHGRGIKIWNDGPIYIGYFEDGYLSTGNFINIYSDGRFEVGEKCYKKDGDGERKMRRMRGTEYKTNGT
jgi:hypothetical protein